MYYEGDPEVEPVDPDRNIDVIYSARNRINADPRVRYRWLEGVRDLEFPVREYAGGISYLDHHVGAVLDSLRANGVMDKSIVMVVADHGEHLTEHDIYFTHRLPYAECLQVPLMIRLPHGVQSGRRVSAPVSLADILPTLMELVGIDVEQELSGRSLVGMMRGGDAEPRLLFAEYGTSDVHWGKSVWDADWRYTEIRSDSVFTAELFDRRGDPREEHDLAGVIEERLRALGYVDGGSD
jgi:arylsulfatase A-like enzyme